MANVKFLRVLALLAPLLFLREVGQAGDLFHLFFELFHLHVVVRPLPAWRKGRRAAGTIARLGVNGRPAGLFQTTPGIDAVAAPAAAAAVGPMPPMKKPKIN